MGTQQGDDTTAALMWELDRHHRRPVRKAPVERASPNVSHGIPMNLTVIAHIEKSVAELVATTRDYVPTATTPPPDPADAYDWCREQTDGLDSERVTVREAIIYRQGLEHSIALGDVKVIRRHTCPGCGCYGLLWRSHIQRAACLNIRCTDRNGLGRTWSLGAIARAHFNTQMMLNSHAT